MNDEALNRVKVHQLLHGYDGGHRLLTGSRELPPSAARRILTQSDLSGTIPPKGFESYITAYPVREIDCYAFARTWYAPEMPRPGCVWTHTFLIENAALKNLEDLRQLSRYFQRPIEGNISTSYSRPLEIVAGRITPLTTVYPPEITREFLRTFYAQVPVPIVLLETVSSELEDLFLEAWAQIWPIARTNLTLSSGSLSPRKIDGRPFDLQLAPQGVVREIVRSASAKLIDGESASVLEEDRWMSLVQEDFVTHGRFGFRAFLTEVEDETLQRSDVPAVARVFARIGDRLSWSHVDFADVFQAIVENFPEAEKATALKARCLALGERSAEPQFYHWVLQELASQDYGSAFSSPVLGLEKKAQKMLEEHPTDAMSLLFGLLQYSLNPFGEQVVKGLISGLHENQAIAFLRERPQLVSTLVRLRPSLAANPQLWHDLRYYAHEILAALAASEEAKPEILQRIFPVLFSSGLEHQASYFVDLFGTAAVRAIFAHRGPLPANLHDRWLDTLASRPVLLLSYMKESEHLSRETLSGIAATLAPEKALSPEFPIQQWIDAVREWEPSFSYTQDAVVEVCAFSLALAFRQAGQISAELAVLSFETVHAAGMNQKIPPVAWVNLEPLLPHISFFRDWDSCERLRRALLAMYSQEYWPIETFGRMLRNPETFQNVMRSASEISMGRTVISLIERAIPEKAISLTEQQGMMTRVVATQSPKSQKSGAKHSLSKRADKMR